MRKGIINTIKLCHHSFKGLQCNRDRDYYTYRLALIKFVSTARAVFGSTQLVLFQLRIYEIRATNVAHLIIHHLF